MKQLDIIASLFPPSFSIPHFEITTKVGGESAASEERLAARPRVKPLDVPAVGWARPMG